MQCQCSSINLEKAVPLLMCISKKNVKQKHWSMSLFVFYTPSRSCKHICDKTWVKKSYTGASYGLKYITYRYLVHFKAPRYPNSRLLGYVTVVYIEPMSHYLGNWSVRVGGPPLTLDPQASPYVYIYIHIYIHII